MRSIEYIMMHKLYYSIIYKIDSSLFELSSAFPVVTEMNEILIDRGWQRLPAQEYTPASP